MSNKSAILLKFKTKDIGNTKRKKNGFTLIEIIAVIAIISIIAAAILPRVTGYIKEAKKVNVLDQSRKVVMAVESYNMKASTPLQKDTTVDNAINNDGVKKYLDDVKLTNLDTKATLQNCYDILDGAEFDFSKDTDVLDPGTIQLNKSNTDK